LKSILPDSTHSRNIPLTKIQDVTVSASIPQRLLGFGDLLIDNASELGGTTVLHNISILAVTPIFFCANSDARIKLLIMVSSANSRSLRNIK